MTSSGMPKVVYMEELVLRIVKTAKLYLQNFLYAQFDPRYRVDKEFGKWMILLGFQDKTFYDWVTAAHDT